MDIHFGTALVLVALIAALLLVLESGDRLFPGIAVVIAIVEVLITFGIVAIASGKWRMDVILPAVLVLCGAVCWARSAGKSSVTSSTLLLSVGLVQLLFALSVLR